MMKSLCSNWPRLDTMPRDKHPQTTWTSSNALGQFQLNRDYQQWIKESNHVSI